MAVQIAEEMDVSSMEESNSATVHGVFVGAVSPVKVSRNTQRSYFEAKLSDGVKSARVVSFEPKLRNEIEEAGKVRRGVAITRCTVKRPKFGGDDLEIVAGSKSAIVSSPKKFKLSDDATGGSGGDAVNYVVSDDLQTLREHQRIIVVGKVVSCSLPQELKGKTGSKYVKQEVNIADSTAVCRGVAWEQHVSSLEEGLSYKFVNVTVRSFNAHKYLSLGEMCNITKVEDIGEVVDDDVAEEPCSTVVKGDIAVVMNIESYSSCRNCNSKIGDVGKAVVECAKCNSKMKLARCAKASIARVLLEDEKGNERQLTMFSDVLDEVAQRGKEASHCDKIEDQILSAPKLCYTISTKEVITSVCTIE